MNNGRMEEGDYSIGYQNGYYISEYGQIDKRTKKELDSVLKSFKKHRGNRAFLCQYKIDSDNELFIVCESTPKSLNDIEKAIKGHKQVMDRED